MASTDAPDQRKPDGAVRGGTSRIRVVEGVPRVQRTFERGDHAELADTLLVTVNPTRDGVRYADGHLYRYESEIGLWTALEHHELRRIVKSFAGSAKVESGKERPLRISLGSVDGAIELACAEVADPSFFSAAMPGVAFQNGYVVVRDGDIRMVPHSADHRARVGFDFEYSPTAPHPLLDKFFADVFADASPEERAARTAIQQEIAGIAMIGEAPKYQKAIINYGAGGTAKSQGARIIEASHPGVVTSLSPHKWGERFSVATLAGARLNVVGELPSADLLSTEMFKAVIVGDPITGERKFQDPFTFVPEAGHVFLANDLPPTRDISHAFFRRFIIVEWTRNMLDFAGHQADIGRFIAARERPGIAAWALEGAARLQRQGHYTVSASGEARLAQWRKEADSVALFADQVCVRLVGQRPVEGTRSTPLYSRYRAWAGDNGFQPVNSKKFAHRMDDLRLGATHCELGSFYPVTLRGRDEV